jgi:hypothetical protein
MAKGARKLTGFLWALLIAVLSFFIIFIFFPDVSNRFFGVSVRGEDIERVVKEAEDTITMKTGEVISSTVEKMTDAAAEAGKKTVSEALQQTKSQTN